MKKFTRPLVVPTISASASFDSLGTIRCGEPSSVRIAPGAEVSGEPLLNRVVEMVDEILFDEQMENCCKRDSRYNACALA